MPQDNPKVTIIIPAYNEEERIRPSMEKIIEYVRARGGNMEILVVNDGSLDKTAEVVETFMKDAPFLRLLNNPQNMGKGRTVQNGVMDARGEYIYFTDADLSTPIEEVDRFLQEIEKYDAVIGSRSMQGANIVIHEPFYREILGKVFCAFVRLFFVPGFVDTQCGAKMFRREPARKIFPLVKISRFAFDVEVLYLALKFGYRVKEMPVTWYYSANTRVRTFIDGPQMLMDLFYMKWAHRNIKS